MKNWEVPEVESLSVANTESDLTLGCFTGKGCMSPNDGCKRHNS